MDVQDFGTLTYTSSNANIEMIHAVYNYVEKEYVDVIFRNMFYYKDL